ncbi:MAG: DUF1236 domain-containing protein [Rhizobiaceae bacterium]|nr:DUF1236 domain-containing protein [Rhizobiaceae bacterium]MCV0407772.1 DUF1236 domain-containing protein [Rhizobiaceae bacterium]
MKHILIKSAIALSLGVAPVAALAQTDQEEPGVKLEEKSSAGKTELKGDADTSMSGDTQAGAEADATLKQDRSAEGAMEEDATSGTAQTLPAEEGTPGVEAEGSAQAEGADDSTIEGQAEAEGAVTDEETSGTAQAEGEADAPDESMAEGEADTPDESMAEGEAADTDDTTTASIPEVTTEQRTQITQIIRETEVEPVDIDVDVSVGVAVPRTVELHPLPPRIIEIVPAYAEYRYFVLADGRIIIVEPATYEVVYIITA